jgi:plasmid stabilization system protein ParE
MRRVVVSQVALQDLRRLEVWLVERSPDAAARIGPMLERAMASLAEHPDRGRVGPRPDLRELVVPFGGAAYLVLYRIGPQEVIIARVKHSRERR